LVAVGIYATGFTTAGVTFGSFAAGLQSLFYGGVI